MTTIQLVIAVAGFISIIAGFIGGAWINQRALERQMDAFRNEIRAEMATLRADVRADIAPIRSDIGQLKQSVEKIERQLEAIFKPIPPGRGD